MGWTREEIGRAILSVLIPLAVSSMAWVFGIVLLSHTSGEDLEGFYYVTTFVGGFCFVVTGPLTGIMLSRPIYNRQISFWPFLALFVAIALPILSYQVVAYSSSILGAFAIGGPWTDRNIDSQYIQTAVLGFVWYLLYAVILYVQARRGPEKGMFVGSLLIAASIVVIFLRLLL